MITSAPLSINTHIENLKQQLSKNELKQLEYVILAHTDNQMIDQLKEAFVDSSIAVIAMPQSCWVMDEEQMDELMDWLLNDLNVARVLLVGHSQGGNPNGNVQVCSSGQVDPATNGPSNRITSILDRVKYGQSCVKQNEKHFLQELDCLKSLPSIKQHILRNQQIVQGLFYRAESGVFCHYDSSTRAFRALILEN